MLSSAARDNFIESLPTKPYCTMQKSGGLRVMQREHAARYSHIQLNHPQLCRYLIFDIDQEGAAYAWEDAGLPAPTYTVINPENAHAHLIYRLADPIWLNHANDKTIRLLKHVKARYTARLGGDPGYQGLICKNPAFEGWRTIDTGRQYTLAGLFAELDEEPAPERRLVSIPGAAEGKGRNCRYFDDVRRWSYKAVKEYNDPDSFASAVYSAVSRANTEGLPSCEIRSIAKSITRWTWRNRHNFAGSPLTAEEIRERQIEAGRKTRAGQAETTRRRLIEALDGFLTEARGLTQAALAAAAGVSLSTVKRCWRWIKERLAGMVSDAPHQSVNSAASGFSAALVFAPSAVRAGKVVFLAVAAARLLEPGEGFLGEALVWRYFPRGEVVFLATRADSYPSGLDPG